MSKKLKPAQVGSWFLHNKTVVVARQHGGVRALQHFGNERYLQEFLKHDNMTTPNHDISLQMYEEFH